MGASSVNKAASRCVACIECRYVLIMGEGLGKGVACGILITESKVKPMTMEETMQC